MITVSGFILLMATLYCGIQLLLNYKYTKFVYYLCLSVASFTISVGLIGSEVESYLQPYSSQQLMVWVRIVSISFALCGLAILLWESKPTFARFPVIFCAVPLLLIPAFVFIINSSTLNELVLALLQVGALAIGFMLYLLKASNDTRSFYVLSGICAFVIALTLHLIQGSIISVPIWLTELIIATGLLFSTYGLTLLINEHNKELRMAV